MFLTEHEIKIHVMCMLYIQFLFVYRNNTEADINIASHQCLIDLCICILSD